MRRGRSERPRRRRRSSRRVGGIIGLVIVGVFILAAVFGGAIFGADDTAVDGARVLEPPSWEHPFGFDQLGRDQVARVVDAAQVALIIGFASVALGAIAGTVLGLLAGYVGGRADLGISGVFEVLFGLPSLLFAIVLAAVFGPGISGAVVAIGLVFVPRFGRIARGSARSIRETEYVDAAKLAGLPTRRIVKGHVFPNAMTPLIVLAALNISVALLTYAALSFLGLGVPPPQADFGSMLAGSRNLMTVAPHLVIFPAAALVLLIIGFNLVGDWLRDELDPRTETGSGLDPIETAVRT